MEADENDIIIRSPDEYSSNKDFKFSHEQLIMTTFQKVIEAGSKEMIVGYFQTKRDKFGNSIQTYIMDSRKVYIESVKTADNLLSCDYDDEAEEKINKLKDEIINIKKKYIEAEKMFWINSNIKSRERLNNQGITYLEGQMSSKNFFYKQFIDFEIDKYREIFTELNKLTKRLDFFSAINFEA